MKVFLKRLSSDYGMAGVLVLLCAYYSWATYTTHEPRGEAAAPVLADQIARSAPKAANVLIVGRATEEDARFAETLEARLKADGLNVVGKVLGDPRAARQALQKYDTERTGLAAIATTPECAAWTVFEGIGEKYPNLGRPRLAIPQSYRWPTFLKKENLLNVANQIVVVAILAIGMTLVIITGGIDLSVGSLIAFSAVVTTSIIRNHGGVEATSGTLVLGSAAGIGACALIGLFSGTMVTAFRVPPFIGTLAVMQVASGLAFIVARGGSIYEVPDSLTWLGRGVGWFGIPHAVVLMAVLYVIAHVLMSRTVLGRYIYAVGGNVEATRLSGVRVGAIVALVYVISGALAGLGGVLLASQLKSGAPTYGLSYELYVIAAVVVGGTSLSGGEGRIFGTLIGALIIAVIQNGMNLTGVESYTQKVVLGIVILGAVLLDMLKRRNWREVFGSLRRWPRVKAVPVAEPKRETISSK
jgi:ribose transport system permease protein